MILIWQAAGNSCRLTSGFRLGFYSLLGCLAVVRKNLTGPYTDVNPMKRLTHEVKGVLPIHHFRLSQTIFWVRSAEEFDLPHFSSGM